MLTYNFEGVETPLYEYIYNCLKKDIMAGRLLPDEKLPSKRMFAKNNGISTITIQNAYDQLISEGYVYTIPKKGYYVANISNIKSLVIKKEVVYDIKLPTKKEEYICDLSYNGINPDNFPFSVWAKMIRSVMSKYTKELMEIAPSGGVRILQEAIADHLRSFRGMMIDPAQIIIGAGTEYLYGLLIQLLGKDKIYAIENPGYKKLIKIYGAYEAKCCFAGIDEEGMTVGELQRVQADVAHLCPNHHFPTGITMPAKRRYEILAWANEKDERYVIEDDYDSEFRSSGKPIPTLHSIDGCEKVIYMNTFSKSLSPTIRISYMILPVHLVNKFYEQMSFYSCTVSNFEQYTLAQFIKEGYFEKHINRMRLHYGRRRAKVLEFIARYFVKDLCEIIENDSGLHFLLKIKTSMSDEELKERLRKQKIKITAVSDFEMEEEKMDRHLFIINYSNIFDDDLEKALEILKGEIDDR